MLRITLALMCLAGSATAMQLDLENPHGIAALYVTSELSGVSHGMNYVVCTDGSGYMVQNQEYGDWDTFNPSPVPLDQVVDWTPWTLYTTDGRWFIRNDPRVAWEQMGVDVEIPPPPCYAPVPAEGSSMGSVKGIFR